LFKKGSLFVVVDFIISLSISPFISLSISLFNVKDVIYKFSYFIIVCVIFVINMITI